MSINHTNPAEILIFGAGSIGRGFLGQIFSRSGWVVTFVDINQDLIDRLNRDGGYQVELISPDGTTETVEVRNVRAINSNDRSALLDCLSRTKYIGTAVGAAILPRVATALKGLLPETELARYDVILAENLHDPEATFTSHLREGVVTRESLPGIHLCAVGKMVPQVRVHDRTTSVATEAMNTLLVDGLDWRNPFPGVPWFESVQPIQAFVDRKLYLHNLTHAAMAFLSVRYCRRCTYVAELTEITPLIQKIREIISLVARGLALDYPAVFTEDSLLRHGEELLYRFSNRQLQDTIERVGRDVMRKLGPGERIVGTLKLLDRYGLPLSPVSEIYEAALEYGVASRQVSQSLFSQVDADTFLTEVSGSDLSDSVRSSLRFVIEHM